MRGWRDRVFTLHAPAGVWESLLYMVVGYAGLVGTMLLFLVPLLFIGCGRDLCGFFE